MQRLPNRDTPIAHGGDAFAEQWHKPELMCEERAAAQLTEYLGECEVRASERAERCTALLRSSSSDARVPRLKRVYEVRARGETMFVLAKSVGWGWLGYPAFIAAEKLADRVPHLLGLRDGILYTQYVPQNGEAQPSVEDIADYVAARARLLRPEAAPSALALKSRNGAVRLLEKSLAGAYGRLLGTAMRPQIGERLRKLPCPTPAWVDGNMQASKWIAGPDGILKTDFEHHGAGKAGVNVLDPAFDLADAIINFELPPDHERRLLDRYIDGSGDKEARQRLFAAKLPRRHLEYESSPGAGARPCARQRCACTRACALRPRVGFTDAGNRAPSRP
jgi:hypothetical protein